MAADPEQPDFSPETERIYVQALARVERGGELDLTALCGAHPEHAQALRRLHGEWRQLLAEQTQGSLARRLKSRYGPEADTDVSLQGEAEPASDFSSEVLERLAGRKPTSSRYKLEGEVARGGMGAILRVWDEDLRRHLAMKVVLGKGEPTQKGGTPEVPTATLARFLEEAQVTGQLDHPGIVPVHELGLDSEDQVYFTMKLVKGKTLKVVFDELAANEGGWTQTRVLGLLLRVCEAMSYAHDKQVIHRDLKPANVMVGKFGEVYVMDWGLAKILGREDRRDLRVKPAAASLTSELRSDRKDHAGDTPDSPLYTMDGDIVGTPAYMSPEQAAGDVGAMGPPSDVYALGAMLYHLLAGHMPYVPPGARLNNYAIWSHVQGGPPRPLREVAQGVPSELVAIAEKAMAREAQDRYANTSELAEDLSAFIEGRVVHAYETGAWAEARKWVGRNRLLVGTAVLMLLSLVLGLAGTLLYASKARAELAERQRFSDSVLVRDLVSEVDEFWPRREETIAAMDDWIARAETILDARADHVRYLAGVRAEIELARSNAAGLRATAGGSEARVDSDLRFRAETLEDLVAGIDRLTELATEVRARRSFAEAIRASSVEQWSQAWDEARQAIAASARYDGLELAPQVGLVPLGPDGESGLWEFWHVESGARPERDADTGRIVLEEQTGLVLVLIPGGRGMIGAQRKDPSAPLYAARARNGEEPRVVELEAFFLSKFELDQAQWLRLAGYNPSTWAPDTQTIVDATLLHPVEGVSWVDCWTILARYELRLPSEEEWEWAARAGTDSPWWTGSTIRNLAEAANLRDVAYSTHWEGVATWEASLNDGYPAHAPVDALQPSPFGLHGLIGNVLEWCANRYRAGAPLSTPTDLAYDPMDPGDRVLRGGGWASTAEEARSSSRTEYGALLVDNDVGVRPARSLDP